MVALECVIHDITDYTYVDHHGNRNGAQATRGSGPGVEFRGESVTVMRNKRAVARIMPGAQAVTAHEAFADLQGLVGEEAAAGWHGDRRLNETLDEELRDPWPADHSSG